MSVNKVKIGNGSHKRTKFDLSHENNTTSDFGFMQPVFGTEMTPDTTIDVNVIDFIRLAPMPQPTFSRAVTYKKFGVFVPYEDIYKPFANLLSGQPYSPSNGVSYIPLKAPYCEVQTLTQYLLSKFAFCVVYKKTLSQDGRIKLELVPGDTFVNDNPLDLTQELMYGEDTVVGNVIFEPDAADFVCDWPEVSPTHRFTWKLSKHGKNLYKILIGLGYQMTLKNTQEISMLPLFAYYKAYFDLFYPQRDITWTNTNLYALLNYMMQNDVTNVGNIMLSESSPEFVYMSKFFEDLSNCYYTYRQDYFSAQLGSTTLEKTDTSLFAAGGNVDFGREVAYSENTGYSPYSQSEDGNGLTAMQVWLVERLTKFVNKNTIVGGKIADWLHAHGMGKYVDEHNCNYIGSHSSRIQVFDVDCTATTGVEGGTLGNYAGKGIGSSDKPGKFKFTSNCYGHFIIMGAIVPNNCYYQGINPKLCHVLPKEFYTPEFDSLGMVATSKSDIMNSQCFIQVDPYLSGDSFGLVPRYSEYKQQQSIVNGDMSLNSSKLYLAGYHLNRMFTDSNFIAERERQTLTPTYLCKEYYMHDNFANSIEWRFCNKYPWMGNFNRIFYNEGGLANEVEFGDELWQYEIPSRDNFIIHHAIDVALYAPYIPMSHAYITDAEDNNAYNFEKQ